MSMYDDFRGDDNTDRQTDLYFTTTHVQGVIKIVTDSSLNFTDTYLEQCGHYDILHNPSDQALSRLALFCVYLPALMHCPEIIFKCSVNWYSWNVSGS